MVGEHTLTEEEAKAKVEKSVFKYTQCGCSFTSDASGVNLAGYAEGSEVDLPPHSLDWGFTYQEWIDTMAIADSEGVEEWNIANPEGF